MRLCYDRLVALAPVLTQRIGGEARLLDTILRDSSDSSDEEAESDEDEVRLQCFVEEARRKRSDEVDGRCEAMEKGWGRGEVRWLLID